MNKLIALAMLLLVPAATCAQNFNRIYTTPGLPSREALDKLNLKLAWRTYVPTDGRQDGIFSVQMADEQVLVQTRSGSIMALNSRDGTTLWRAYLDVPYRVNTVLGWNTHFIFATRATTLFAVDRATGQVAWSFPLPGGPTAAAAADDEHVFVTLGTGKLFAYEIPHAAKKLNPGDKELAVEEKAIAADTAEKIKLAADLEDQRKREAYSSLGIRARRNSSIAKNFEVTGTERTGTGPQPRYLWEYKSLSRLEQTPLLTEDRIVIAGQNGTFTVTNKSHLVHNPFTFEAGATLAAPLGHYAIVDEDDHLVELAYVPTTDNNLFAVNTTKGRVDWRFLAGAPLHSQPRVTDDDIYVGADPTGLYRLDRKTGREYWRNMQARRFLAMNKKFVYATNIRGNMLVLDREHGHVLGRLDTHEFIGAGNEATDRIFLASNDGLLICLHDRDYPTLMRNRNLPVKKAADDKSKPEPKAEEK